MSDIDKKFKKVKTLISQKYEKNIDDVHVDISFMQVNKLSLYINVDTDKFTLNMDDIDDLMKEIDNIISKNPRIKRSDLITDFSSIVYNEKIKKVEQDRCKEYSKLVSSLLNAILIEEYNIRTKLMNESKEQIYKKHNIL